MKSVLVEKFVTVLEETMERRKVDAGKQRSSKAFLVARMYGVLKQKENRVNM
jgi:hypothetical protein